MRSTIPLLALLFVPPLHAAEPSNWPQWRGPDANCFVKRGNPPISWDAKPNFRWKAPLPGKGSSTPIVWGDKVFVLSAVDTGRKADPADLPMASDRKFIKKTPVPDTWHQFVV